MSKSHWALRIRHVTCLGAFGNSFRDLIVWVETFLQQVCASPAVPHHLQPLAGFVGRMGTIMLAGNFWMILHVLEEELKFRAWWPRPYLCHVLFTVLMGAAQR